jgi:hypothetical protein
MGRPAMAAVAAATTAAAALQPAAEAPGGQGQPMLVAVLFVAAPLLNGAFGRTLP